MEKLYTKEINNEIKVLPKYKIVIVKDNSQTFDPSEEMLFEDGWSVYEEPVMEIEEKEPTLEEIKRDKIWDIRQYDRSKEINQFYLNGDKVWFNKNERLNLKFRIEAEKLKERSETNLWYKDTLYVLPIDIAIQIINDLEVYASECYDITKQHCATVNSLESIELVQDYDYKVRYPEVLNYEY